MQVHRVGCIVLEQDSVSVARRLILLIEVPSLEFVSLVCRPEPNFILIIVWVFLKLIHGDVELIELLAHVH